MENITQERLDRVIEVYKNGVANWFRDSHFLLDCAYYEGAIDRACEHLKVTKPYTHITITPQLQESYQNGYDNFWA
jgi:hypothetical protein